MGAYGSDEEYYMTYKGVDIYSKVVYGQTVYCWKLGSVWKCSTKYGNAGLKQIQEQIDKIKILEGWGKGLGSLLIILLIIIAIGSVFDINIDL